MSLAILIIKEGLLVFHRSYKEKSVEKLDLTASFLQALADFSKVEVGQDLETLSMSNSRYYFAQKQGAFFVLVEEQDSTRTKEQAGVLLDALYKRFLEEFPFALEKWTGQMSLFEGFGPACDAVMQVQPTRKGFPAVFRIVLNPYVVTPVFQLLPLSHENETSIEHLLGYLQKYAEHASLRTLRKIFENPHLIYLPSTRHIVFVYAFRQSPKDKDVSHLLCYLVAEEEWFTFYQLIPLFQKRALRFLPSLTEFLQKLEKSPASIEVKQKKASVVYVLTDWADLNQYIGGMEAVIFDELLKSSNRDETIQAILSEQTVRKRFYMFLKAAGDDIDKIIFAVLGMQQILFVGENRRLVEDVLSAFLTYYPRPSVKLWAEEPSDCLLVGTAPGQIKNYPKGTVAVDLDNGRVIGGEKNEFCGNLIKETEQVARKANALETRTFFLAQVGTIFSLLKALLMALFIEGRVEQRQKFQDILKSYPETTIRLVGQISKNLHPLLAKRIRTFSISAVLGYVKFTQENAP